jgi:hypothetical protein
MFPVNFKFGGTIMKNIILTALGTLLTMPTMAQNSAEVREVGNGGYAAIRGMYLIKASDVVDYLEKIKFTEIDLVKLREAADKNPKVVTGPLQDNMGSIVDATTTPEAGTTLDKEIWKNYFDTNADIHWHILHELIRNFDRAADDHNQISKKFYPWPGLSTNDRSVAGWLKSGPPIEDMSAQHLLRLAKLLTNDIRAVLREHGYRQTERTKIEAGGSISSHEALKGFLRKKELDVQSSFFLKETEVLSVEWFQLNLIDTENFENILKMEAQVHAEHPEAEMLMESRELSDRFKNDLSQMYSYSKFQDLRHQLDKVLDQLQLSDLTGLSESQKQDLINLVTWAKSTKISVERSSPSKELKVGITPLYEFKKATRWGARDLYQPNGKVAIGYYEEKQNPNGEKWQLWSGPSLYYSYDFRGERFLVADLNKSKQLIGSQLSAGQSVLMFFDWNYYGYYIY